MIRIEYLYFFFFFVKLLFLQLFLIVKGKKKIRQEKALENKRRRCLNQWIALWKYN